MVRLWRHVPKTTSCVVVVKASGTFYPLCGLTNARSSSPNAGGSPIFFLTSFVYFFFFLSSAKHSNSSLSLGINCRTLQYMLQCIRNILMICQYKVYKCMQFEISFILKLYFLIEYPIQNQKKTFQYDLKSNFSLLLHV